MHPRCFAAAALLLCAPAWALKDGDTVYVRARNTKWLKEPRPNADTRRVLKSGEPLTWRRAAGGNFHEVQPAAEKQTGFVYFANLALRPPREEKWSAVATSTDTEAFATSGAATKGLAEGAYKLAATDEALAEAAKALMALDALQAGITAEDVDAQLRRVGGEAQP